eukprot:m.6931 g.6931  ORF g.6931 m.6931 type:complete len:88 (+) comp5018_c0_seq1:86-349(+)
MTRIHEQSQLQQEDSRSREPPLLASLHISSPVSASSHGQRLCMPCILSAFLGTAVDNSDQKETQTNRNEDEGEEEGEEEIDDRDRRR